ncbi:hypothetical protein BCR33DRAFT_735396 [Rhizoclosmatium globosum]|uniref:DDE-1 domain-containing protein n=1 Tax=Rhizoclosmatium globosum TaxID=329046 RepID=A0A1Y2CN92_9FUNG|nr:hypothetical protein BCR33DRAFT_735396 [Rhizoclosmatium globosum]|eukprot:ORY48518.1 hypothetical protein BCR33DRAFT_735396 [Rhizoclosmatium globosum]
MWPMNNQQSAIGRSKICSFMIDAWSRISPQSIINTFRHIGYMSSSTADELKCGLPEFLSEEAESQDDYLVEFGVAVYGDILNEDGDIVMFEDEEHGSDDDDDNE